MRHVAVMTATGSTGLIAIFSVDFLSLFWVSKLGDQSLKAAIGYASQVGFLAMSVNIGFTIAISATVSRALGQGNPERARRLAAASLFICAVAAGLVAAGLLVFRDNVLTDALHASGVAGDVANKFLVIALPANVPMALGMGLSGVLRAGGDAKRAMYVTLAGGVATAIADPLLIFGLGLGVYGAAWATVISRLTFVVVGVYGAMFVHNLVGRLDFKALARDALPIFGVGGPAILTNLATPVAALYVTRIWSDFGEAAVAGGAIVDRVIPLAFGVIFALTGSVGPIIGQNYGARLMERVQRAIVDSLVLSVGYALAAWLVLALAAPRIVAVFGATGEAEHFVLFFCRVGCAAWVFITCIFVANTAFNNLGYAALATAFNWGRATLGTIPFATIGAIIGGVEGAMLGLAGGAAFFGIGAVIVAMRLSGRLATTPDPR